MKTIEERAKELYQGDNEALNVVGIDGYIKGATEQREIDIQNAYDVCCKVCRDAYSISGYRPYCSSCDRKNELCKAMKGA